MGDITNFEHVRAIRLGLDYPPPHTAMNSQIEGLVHCALIVRDHETNLTPETRALDAIGVQVERELGNRAQMILALTDRLATVEAELREAREELRRSVPILSDEQREAIVGTAQDA